MAHDRLAQQAIYVGDEDEPCVDEQDRVLVSVSDRAQDRPILFLANGAPLTRDKRIGFPTIPSACADRSR